MAKADSSRNPALEFWSEIDSLDRGAYLGLSKFFRPNHKNSKEKSVEFGIVKISNYSIEDRLSWNLDEVERLLDLGYDFKDLDVEFDQETWQEIEMEL